MRNGSVGSPGNAAIATSTPPDSIKGCGLLKICFVTSEPSLLSELARVTIRPPETETISAGITVTRPSPMVRTV